MYVPEHFAVRDQPTLHGFLERYAFATLVSSVEGVPFASHVPLLLDRNAGPRGTLMGHVARANPHWRAFDGHASALAIFHGPHAYVSPMAYASKPAVPTWNYAVAHVYGRPLAFDDPTRLGGVVDALARAYESGRDDPWPGTMPAPFREKMLAGIVGFSLEIERIEAKWKLSQNRPRGDQRGVVAALERSGLQDEAALAALMRTACGLGQGDVD